VFYDHKNYIGVIDALIKPNNYVVEILPFSPKGK